MARVKNNIVMQGTSGAIGKDVVLKVINGKNFATKFPDMSNIVFNEEQLECRNVFGNANKYASSVLKDAQKKAAYLAAFYELVSIPGT